eukprot:664786-Rhodomonas_salina.1
MAQSIRARTRARRCKEGYQQQREHQAQRQQNLCSAPEPNASGPFHAQRNLLAQSTTHSNLFCARAKPSSAARRDPELRVRQQPCLLEVNRHRVRPRNFLLRFVAAHGVGPQQRDVAALDDKVGVDVELFQALERDAGDREPRDATRRGSELLCGRMMGQCA